ncbi:MAG: PIN domain-containing protein [Pseudomonadota bacterium]|nr:PIN domain-containing protein [Pseudomonadota bacterium]
MEKKKLVLFPDTNVFIQCKDLREVQWTLWGNAEEIALYVARPVVAEIDHQKSKGQGRIATRARKASALFKEIITSRQAHVVRTSNPSIRLHIRQDLKPDQNSSELLDYTERDDQLVGIAWGFAKTNPDLDVRILTHDAGPLASAQMVGLNFDDVPDDWLLAPESDERDKREAALTSDLNQYKKAAPAFKTWFEHDGERISVLKTNCLAFSALDPKQIASLIDRITARYPVAEDFGSREWLTRGTAEGRSKLGEHHDGFIPASADQIDEYKDAHARWLKQCEARLRRLHVELTDQAPRPELWVWIENTGAKPADDALVSLAAEGSILILPISSSDDDDKAIAPDMRDLPKPPNVPRGSYWKGIAAAELAMSVIAPRQFLPSMPQLNRERNAFYWRPERPSLPVASMELECAQWRHQISAECFRVTVLLDSSSPEVSALLRVKVHAANLIEAHEARIPVNIAVNEVSAWEKAQELVNRLIKPPATLTLKTTST